MAAKIASKTRVYRDMKKFLNEEEIDMLLDEGYEIDVYMRGGEVVVETDEAP